MPPALSFHRVAKAYAGAGVLLGLDLELPAGQYFALVGVNGAGKTTAIKALLDFTAIDAGAIRIFGEDHRRTRSRERLAYLPERFTPPEFLTARGFLSHLQRLHGEAFVESAARDIFNQLDLDWTRIDRPVGSLSKGMAQKLGLAGCLLSGKPLLVLDEPMSGLDPKARVLVKRHLLARKASGQTVFFSTHMLADVAELCDCMGILHDGGLRFIGSPADCLRTYAAENIEQAYLNCISTA